MKAICTTLFLLLTLLNHIDSQSYCGDNIKNGDEAGIDCGGLYCPPCFNNGAPTLQRKFTHHKFATLEGLTINEMAVDTSGEHMIVSSSDKKVFVLKTDGSLVSQIFDYDDWRSGCPCRAPFVDISANGEKVLWTDGQGELWVANFDGSGKGHIVDTIPNAVPGFADLDYFSSMPPRFTHDAEKIIFSLDNGGLHNIGLYSVNTGGGNPAKFVSVEDIGGDDPILYGGNNFTSVNISAENDIVFASSIKTGFQQMQVFIYDKNDNLELLYPNGPFHDSHTGVRISRNGEYVLINDARVIPGTVIKLNRLTNEIRTIDPPGWSGLQASITISSNDDASLLLLNNYSFGTDQSDILVNQDGMVIYPLHQSEINNKFTNARNMLMPANGQKLYFTVNDEIWLTELNPETIDEDFPQMLSYSISPNWVAKNPVTSTTIQSSAQEGALELVTQMTIVDFDEANQPYDRVATPGAGFTTTLYNDGLTNGDLSVDDMYTNNNIQYRSRIDDHFPDTLTLRFHVWGTDRISSYDIYPFFVLEDALTSTSNLSILQQFQLRPNLSNDQINLNFEVAAPTNISYTIVDVLGQTIQKSSSERIAGSQSIAIDISAFQEGTYFLIIDAEGKLYAQPFMKF